jgi:hypothetical protein
VREDNNVQKSADDPEAMPDYQVRGRKMVEVLEKLAAINALKSIVDPVAWEREQRQDRQLPDRAM